MTSLVRATAVMSLGTVLSRVTGVLRLVAIAYALGVVESGRLTDTYNLANTAPNIIYELVLGGVLTSVFVPMFVELLEKEGREKAWQIGSAIINLSLLALCAITALLILIAPWIARFYSFRLQGSDARLQEEVITFLFRFFIPQIVFYGIYSLVAGFLNAHRRFGPPMYTPVLNNVIVIAVFVWFHWQYGAVDLSTVTTSQLLLIGLGTTAGVAASSLALLPFSRGLGRYRLTTSWRHPAIRALARRSLFVIGYVISNQIGYVIVQWLANGSTGGYTAYVAAFTFFMLPHGLFAVSVITALLPGMSEHAVHQRWDRYREQLSTGVRGTVLLILPAAVGYLVLSEPVVRLLLQHGVMTATSTELVSNVLRFFVLGLVPFSVFQLFLRAFYALQDTRTPFLINCCAIAINIAVNIPLFQVLGVGGLALGHAVSYVAGVALQARVLSQRIGGLDGRRVWKSLSRIALAAAGMGGFVWLLSAALQRWLSDERLLEQTAGVGVPLLAGVGCYLLLARVVGVQELALITSLARRNPVASGRPDR